MFGVKLESFENRLVALVQLDFAFQLQSPQNFLSYPLEILFPLLFLFINSDFYWTRFTRDEPTISNCISLSEDFYSFGASLLDNVFASFVDFFDLRLVEGDGRTLQMCIKWLIRIEHQRADIDGVKLFEYARGERVLRWLLLFFTKRSHSPERS